MGQAFVVNLLLVGISEVFFLFLAVAFLLLVVIDEVVVCFFAVVFFVSSSLFFFGCVVSDWALSRFGDGWSRSPWEAAGGRELASFFFFLASKWSSFSS